MNVSYEYECGRAHALEGTLSGERSGYSDEVRCECGAVYALSVTMLRPPRGG
jgi:hypothetical protein